MADLITALWLGSLLYLERTAATDGFDNLASNSNLFYTSIFTGLGFVIGNVGSNLASEINFIRLLWPERYHITTTPLRLALIGLTMSAAGPFQTAGKRTLDNFYQNGLFKGGKEGDMLGTAFFEDLKTGFKVFEKSEGGTITEGSREDARNSFWTAVIRLLPIISAVRSDKDEEKLESKTGEFANRRVYHLTLSQANLVSSKDGHETLRRIDLQPAVSTMLVGIVSSEMSAVLTGCAVAAIWHSPFASIWFSPLFLRLLAFRFRVRRTPLIAATASKAGIEEPCVFELEDYSNGFVLIEAPKAIGIQFFRHLGHPLRSRLPSDRWNERISMVSVLAITTFFPVSWVLIAFAPNGIRLTWLGYQLYLLMAMLVLNYGNALRVGSVEDSVAQALHTQEAIQLGDGDTGYIKVDLKRTNTSRISEAREVVETTKLEILGLGKKDS